MNLKTIESDFNRKLDVTIFEHLLSDAHQKLTKPLVKQQKARALFKHLLGAPENEVVSFLTQIAGLYPELFRGVFGRQPTELELSKYCPSVKLI